MNQRAWFFSGVLAGAIAFVTTGVLAQTSGGTPSQSQIEQGLKTRGLPSLGTAPVPQGANPAVMQANVPSYPSQEKQSQPARRSQHRANVVPRSTTSVPSVQPSVALNTIMFKFGSAELDPRSTETLRNLGNALNQGLKEEKVFVIEGHTDRAGSNTYNEELSKQRAEAVKAYLVKELGVSADRLQAVGKGFAELANPRDPFGGENRRVVVINAGAM
jgi:outer membrane protein OmpA-like peptidoglycan-associated protein